MAKNSEVKVINLDEGKIEMTPNENTVKAAELLQERLAQYSNITIRKMAAQLEVSYGRLLKASRAPVVGQPYDPENTNFYAMAEILGVDKILDAPWELMNTPSESKATLAKDMSAFKVGDLVYLRRDNEVPFQIIHITETHVVIQQGETPYAWSIGTFMINGPSFEKRTKKAAE